MKKVAHLLEGIEQCDCEVGIIEISNFDDFLYRVYASKCTAESTILKLGEAQSKLEPFVFASTPRKKPFIKYNAFISKQDGIPKTIRCAKTSIANYKSLKEIIGDMPIAAALKNGMIYFACELQYIVNLKPFLTE